MDQLQAKFGILRAKFRETSDKVEAEFEQSSDRLQAKFGLTSGKV